MSDQVDTRPLKVTDDLATVMIATNGIDNWPRLGLALGVPQPTINHIRQQYPNPLDQQEQILSHWIGTGEATWAKLVTAIAGPLVNKKGLADEIARNHPAVSQAPSQHQYGGSQPPSVPPNGSYEDVLDKPPDPNDIMDLIKNDISSSWNSVGSELNISMNDRDTLRRDGSLTDTNKLEQIVNEWRRSETKPVTWRTMLKALKSLGRQDLIRKVIDYLQMPENYRKYISMNNYSRITF